MKRIFKILLAAGVWVAVVSTGYLYAQATSSSNMTAHFNSSLAREANGEIAAAITEMSALYAEAQDNYLVNLRLGWLEYLNDNYDASAGYYRHAYKIIVIQIFQPTQA